VLWRGFDGNPELYMYDLTLLPPEAPVVDWAASTSGDCPGDQAVFVLENAGPGLIANWFADEQLSTLLYADAANSFEVTPSSQDTFYAAWQNPITGCIGEATPVALQFTATDNLACDSNIVVPLDDQCIFELTTDFVFAGSFGCLGANDFEISVMDGTPGNGPIVDGPGTFVYQAFLAPGATGNFTTCWGNVTVEDLSPISLQCPGDQTIQAAAGQSSAPAFWADPLAMDNCPISLNGTHDSGDLFPVGVTQVTYTATGISGNTVGCSFSITVSSPLDLQCPDDVVVSNDPGACDAFVSIPVPALPGPGTLISSQGGPDASGVYPVGATVVTYTYFEGNDTLTCSFSVTVLDTEPPMLECASDTTLYIGGGNRDDGKPLGDDFPLGTTCVLWIAEDMAGNRDSCTMCVTVELQGSPPQITCPPDVMLFTDPDLCENNSFVMPDPIVVNDSCAPFLGLSFQPGAYGPYPKGEHTFTFFANNIFGTDSCQVTVTVEDNEPPMLLCPPDVTLNADPSDGGTVVVFDDFQASDNCPMTILDCSHQTGDFFPCGETVVECVLTDMAGNTAECSFTVTVACVNLSITKTKACRIP
jgi:large repetitive protein